MRCRTKPGTAAVEVLPGGGFAPPIHPGEEVTDHCDIGLGLLEVGEMPGTLDDRELRTGDERRTLLLGDIGNQMDIQDTATDVADLQSRLSDQDRANMAHDERIIAPEKEAEELKLYLASLLRLLVRKGPWSARSCRPSST